MQGMAWTPPVPFAGQEHTKRYIDILSAKLYSNSGREQMAP